MRRRETGLLAVALTIVAGSLLTETRRDVSAAAPVAADPARAGQNARPRAELAALDVDEWLARLKARGMNRAQSGPGLFGGTSWQPQPDPAANVPVKPQTPPFPFVLLGRMTLGGSTVVVLAKGEVSYTAKAGQVIDQFRIDRVDDDGLRVTYVPNGEARDYRYEQLYAAASAAPQPAMAALPAQPVQPVLPPQMADAPDSQAQPQLQSAPGAAGRPAGGASPGGVAAAAANVAASNAAFLSGSQVPGAAAPIGGMVINPGPPGGGMVITPTTPDQVMAITPPQPGSGMVMTPAPPGLLMPGLSGMQSGRNTAPAPQ
jgi:hypothetical protein